MDNNLSGMMASRPEAATGGGPSTSNAPPGVSIGNYKGVMLCNRPFAGLVTRTTAQRQGNNGAEKTIPFLPSALPDEPLGLNPIRNRPLALAQIDRAKRDSAINRHRRYIKSLQSEKRALQAELEEQQKIRDARRARFRTKQREMREKVVMLRHGGEEKYQQDSTEGKVRDEDETRIKQQRVTSKQQKQEIKKAYLESIGMKDDEQVGAKSRKPKWAMTEKQIENHEESELNGLLEFATGLDIEEFLDDLEVKSALEAVKTRVRQLKRENEFEEKRYQESLAEEQRALEGIPLSLLGDDDSGDVLSITQDQQLPETQLEDEALSVTSYVQKRVGLDEQSSQKTNEGKECDDTIPMQGNAEDGISVADARSILSSSSVKSLRSIHSNRSIAKLAQGVMRRMSLESVEEEETKRNDVVLPPPRIVHISEDGGTRLCKKDKVSNLPYMHRNPAI